MAQRRSSITAFGASLALALTLLAWVRLGEVAIAALLVLAGLVALVARPEWALGVAVGLPLLVEPEADWGPSPLPARIYELIPGTKLDPVEGLVLLALAAALLDRPSAGAPRRPLGIMAAPLAILTLALLAGAVTGHDAGAGYFTLFNSSRNALLLLAVPVAVTLVVGSRVSLRTALGALLALAAAKGVIGMVALVTGQTAASLGSRPITYYYAPANALIMFALLFCLAARLRHVALPRWVWATVPFMTASLLLSYRRSFWVATMLGVVLVLLFAVGRYGRRLGLSAAIAIGAAFFLSLGSGVSNGLTPYPTGGDSGLAGRLTSLNPAAISQSKDDRYRLGERRNVLAALRDSPVAGLGLGVDYRARYPLSIGSIPRDYVHFAVLWWWMKTGLLGIVGYLGMLLTAIWAGTLVFRRHPDPLVSAGGLAAAVGFTGFATAETTATFVGPDPRSSILVGALLGLLAVAHREAIAVGPAVGWAAGGEG